MSSNLDGAVAALSRPDSYHRCLLLVHPGISSLEAATRRLVTNYGWPYLSMRRELAAALFSRPAAKRRYRARERAETTIMAAAPGPLLLTEIDLRFEPTLRLDRLARHL